MGVSGGCRVGGFFASHWRVVCALGVVVDV